MRIVWGRESSECSVKRTPFSQRMCAVTLCNRLSILVLQSNFCCDVIKLRAHGVGPGEVAQPLQASNPVCEKQISGRIVALLKGSKDRRCSVVSQTGFTIILSFLIVSWTFSGTSLWLFSDS